MAKITKGTKCYLFHAWDDKAAHYAREIIITSFGKKQGTAVKANDETNCEFRIYPATDHIVPVADIDDVQAFGLKLAENQRANAIQNLVNLAHHNAGGGNDAYFIHMKKRCQDLLDATPTFFIK